MSDRLIVPSGRMYSEFDLNLIRELDRVKTIAWGTEYPLNSGIKTRLYLHGREDWSENPALYVLVARKLLTTIEQCARGDHRTICLIGVPDVGNVLAMAAMMANAQGGWISRRVEFRFMRKNRKLDHSADGAWVTGKPDITRHRYIVIENTLTSGSSTLNAAQHLAEDGYPAIDLDYIFFFDRGQGGFENLINSGKICRLFPVYLVHDIVHVLHAPLGLWSLEQVRAVEKDLKTHAPLRA